MVIMQVSKFTLDRQEKSSPSGTYDGEVIGRTAILLARDEAGLELFNASEFVKSPRLLVKYQGLYQLIPRFWRKQAQGERTSCAAKAI